MDINAINDENVLIAKDIASSEFLFRLYVNVPEFNATVNMLIENEEERKYTSEEFIHKLLLIIAAHSCEIRMIFDKLNEYGSEELKQKISEACSHCIDAYLQNDKSIDEVIATFVKKNIVDTSEAEINEDESNTEAVGKSDNE